MAHRGRSIVQWVWAILLALSLLGTTPHPVSAQKDPIWFDDIAAPLDLTPAERDALVRYVAAALADGAGDVPAVPGDDGAPRIVHLSVSDGLHRARIVQGAGPGLVHALDEAIAAVRPLAAQGITPRWLKLDIVQSATPVESLDMARPLDPPASLEGLAFDRASGIAFLPEELMVYSLVDANGVLLRDHIATYLSSRPEQSASFERLRNSNPVSGYRFSSLSLFYDSDASSVVELYRGHERASEQPTPDELLVAARLAGGYLTAQIQPSGRFAYVYRPHADDIPEGYNIVRHAGTIYAMMEIYKVLPNDALLVMSRRAIDYLLGEAERCGEDAAATSCIPENGRVDLGANALALLALAKYTSATGDAGHLPAMRELARWVQSMQGDDGKFTERVTYPDGDPVELDSWFYPGESIFALARLYGVDPDPAWLDTAERAADYLIEVRDAGKPVEELRSDHWLLYGLSELYVHRPKDAYLEHTARLAQATMRGQHHSALYLDWLGGYHSPPSITSTATRSEGLSAAYWLLREHGDPVLAEQVLDSVRLSVSFQLQGQYRPESALYFRNPRRALGGFRGALDDFPIRIDYVQHNVSGILGLYKIETGG